MDVSKLIMALKGTSPDSPLVGRLAELAERKAASFKIVAQPGDTLTNDHVMSIPPSPDLWYIFNHVNMLTWADSTPADSFMEERLPFFESKLGGIKPLKGIVSSGEVTGKRTWFTDKMEWSSDAHDWVQLIASELKFNGQSFQYSTEIKLPENVVGYIMIPIGGQGVMEVISLIQESIIEDPSFSLPGEENPKTLSSGIDSTKNLFPPTSGWISNSCYGRKLIYKTTEIPEKEIAKVFIESRYKTTFSDIYSKSNSTYGSHTFVNGTVKNTKLEIPMEKIYGKGVTQDGTYNSSQPGLSLISYIPQQTTKTGFKYGGGWIGKHWLRVWITREDKWPVPGEFIGILVKPCPVPPHVWWFQRSSPLLYAGNWIDTLDLTSGVVIEVIQNIEHPLSKALCTEYKVKIHGVNSVRIYSSDFLVYEVGKRVAIFKYRIDEVPLQLKEGQPGTDYLTRPDLSYDQMEQQEWGEPIKDTVYESYYVILPLTFFK